MIKIVSTLGGWHDDKVAKEVDKLQSNGYNVKDIKRISRDYFIFGKDVTHIIYEKK